MQLHDDELEFGEEGPAAFEAAAQFVRAVWECRRFLTIVTAFGYGNLLAQSRDVASTTDQMLDLGGDLTLPEDVELAATALRSLVPLYHGTQRPARVQVPSDSEVLNAGLAYTFTLSTARELWLDVAARLRRIQPSFDNSPVEGRTPHKLNRTPFAHEWDNMELPQIDAFIVDPSDMTPEDPAVASNSDGDVLSIEWNKVRNDTLRNLYFEHGYNPAVRDAAAVEVGHRLNSGTMNRPRFDAASFRVWKEDRDHAEEDSGGDQAAGDAAGSGSLG
ncbi:MAG TPA: hypothetical protein VHB92_02070 [Humibacter sp.]|nr:hypothetical protein [Humibacter sp.]